MSTGIEVYAIRYGSRVSTKGETFLNFPLYGEPDMVQPVDYFYWVIRDGDDVTVVDTGFAPEAGRRRGRDAESTPEQSLLLLGIDPAAVRRVLLTHAHYDHTGNVHQFPAAEVVMSRAEYDFWTSPVASRLQFAAFAEEAEIGRLTGLSQAGRLTLIDAEHVPAPGIRLLTVGGHTPGQMIVVVDDRIVLASDALHFYEEVERDRPFNIVADLPGMYRAYDRLAELAARPGTRLVAGHDPAVRKRFPTEGDLTCLSA